MSELSRRLGPIQQVPAECGGPWWRRATRNVLLHGLSAMDRVLPAGRGRTVQIALFHQVRPKHEQRFRRFLEKVSRTYTLVNYDDAVRAVRGEIPRSGPDAEQAAQGAEDRMLAISFDDGTACNVRSAAILEEFGIRGAFFICPPVHDERDPAVLARYCRQRLRHQPASFMTWEEIETLIARGHVIGGHTQSHVNLGEVSVETAAEEIGSCREALLRRLGRADHFAWPYGMFRQITNGALDEVFACGFLTCASGVRGAHTVPQTDGRYTGPTPVLHRESLDPAWPMAQQRYFLNRSCRRPLPAVPTVLQAAQRAA